jgi:hypothetical protein
MATTRRESTAHPRSENASNTAGLRLVPALGFGPHISNAADVICQETTFVPLPVRNPWVSWIGDAVDTALALHSKGGGATVSVLDGNMAGQKLYAVSIHPELTLELKHFPNWRLVFAYALENAAALLKPERALGLWYDREKEQHVLDFVVCCPDLRVAMLLGQRYHQSSIFDLAAGREIQINRPARPLRLVHAGGRNA